MLELGILKTFNSENHKAGVQLAGSLTTYLDDISVSVSIPSSAMVVGNYVLVAIPGGNLRDACIVASWPQGSSGEGGGSKIQDADGDTYLWVEKTADEDKIHGVVKNVEAFLIHDDGILDLPKQSGFMAHQTSDQTIPNVTYTVLNMHAKAFDTQNEYDLANDKFTADEAGIYFVTVSAKIRVINIGDWVMAQIYHNGTAIFSGDKWAASDGQNVGAQAAGFVKLAATDYLEAKVKHNFGANRMTWGERRMTYFGAAKVA